jgi:cell division protein FtsQ
MKFSRRKIRAFLLGVLWIIAAAGSTVLLVAAVRKNDKKECKGIRVQIEGVSNHYFIDKKDVEKIIAMYEGDQKVGKPIANFDLDKMENALQRNIWIKKAQIYFDNNGVLQVDVEEREPVARIFTRGGASFYIDSTLMMLPLSERLSARLPVFTGFPSEAAVLNKKDSALLKDVRTISVAIQEDPFLNSMIEQVDITFQRQFEMIPKIGNQLIVFGDASDTQNKFRKLKLFYKNVITKTGWSRYSAINLQYKDQVVGKLRGADDVSADSLRTIQLMQLIAANTEKMAADTARSFVQDNEKNTTDSSMVMHSMQRDETQDATPQPLPEMQEVIVPAKVEPKATAVVPPATTKETVKAKAKTTVRPTVKPTVKAAMPPVKKKATVTKKVPAPVIKKTMPEKKSVNNDY